MKRVRFIFRFSVGLFYCSKTAGIFVLKNKTLQISRGNSLRRVKNGSKWKVKEISLDGGNKENDGGGNKSNRNSANLSGTEISPALMAQANWTFVEKLLKVSGLSGELP